MIEVNDVSKHYGSKAVVDNVSLKIPPGRITSFIGPNGAGKSTLLSLMSRLVKRSEGEVRIGGKSIDEWKPNELAKKLSILKQTNTLSIRLSVRDLVSFGRFPYSEGRLTPEDREQVEEALHYMNMVELGDRYIDELSGGQRQRAFLAMVLAQNTDCILLDEPLNNLDMKHSVQIMKLLRQLVEERGKTIVVVLHDINFASCYSDRIVALRDGRIVRDGLTEEIIESGALREIYDMDIPIETIGGRKIGVYFS
ncbi:iron ABC transporter ATP-binding protein [Gorillibacterium timonense]|uniref:iron ABC transporter ATP-binding protein n=1 Tax=Gorillibacterium timonense TaxID=1689269 RepID=UPI00071D39FB|nr:ABC transporter ATP-binding protein [Gorillibacterium timonense]